MRNRFAAFTVLCTLGLLRVPAAAAQTTALLVDSQAGDFVGGGLSRTWVAGELTFSVVWSKRSDVIVRAGNRSSGGTTEWDLQFTSPAGTELTPGTYEYTSNRGGNSPFRPSLTIASERGACTATGRFVLYEIGFDSAGMLTNLAADFEQHCNDAVPALFGALRFNATRISLVPFDGVYPVYALHVNPSAFGRVTGGGLDCGDGGTTCDAQYGTVTTVTLTATAAAATSS